MNVTGPRRINPYDDELVAIVCHDAAVGMQKVHEIMRLHGEDYVITGPFAVLHPDLHAAAIEGVRRVRREGASLSPRDHHDAWVAFLLVRGWRPGPGKDPENKIHPNLVPWDELSPEQRDKDRVFIGIVVSLTLDVAA